MILFLFCHSTYIYNWHFSLERSFSSLVRAVCLPWTTEHSLKQKTKTNPTKPCLLSNPLPQTNSFKLRSWCNNALLKCNKFILFSCTYFTLSSMVFSLNLWIKQKLCVYKDVEFPNKFLLLRVFQVTFLFYCGQIMWSLLN